MKLDNALSSAGKNLNTKDASYLWTKNSIYIM